jgi:fructose-bisphosphate aldolase, class I
VSKTHSLEPILRNGYGMLLAYDHGFEHGPIEFDERNADPKFIMDIANSGHFTGVICQKGIAARYYHKDEHSVPLILKLNGKTNYHHDEGEEPISVQNCTIDEAIQLGAIAVGYTIFMGSDRETEMFKEFAAIEREAHDKGLIVMAWMYPRGHHIKSDEDPETLEYAARLGLELNADAVKIKYTGDIESYKRVVEVAADTKVFVVGGPKTDTPEELYQTAEDIKTAGAVGLAIGRNVWQAENPLEVAAKLAEIMYK